MAPRKKKETIDTVRASRAGHSFHEYWAARRTLELVFPNDDLHAIAIESLSSDDDINPGAAAQEIADLTLYFGSAATFAGCTRLQTLQFKYKADQGSVSASYLKKTVQKFAQSLIGHEKASSAQSVTDKLSFGFVTNAQFSDGLWTAIEHIKAGTEPARSDAIASGQYENLVEWTKEKGTTAARLFPMIEFRAAEKNLPAQKEGLRRSITDWSGGADGQARGRLQTLLNLVQEKAGLEGHGANLIRREDVLDALGCDEDDLFPAQTQFADVGPVVSRAALSDVEKLIETAAHPVFIDADGGVGKTVFVETLARQFSSSYEVVLFDCFGGGTYRSDTQERHLPKIGLVQVTNELASRGLCDPMLPSDNDSLGVLAATRRRLNQAVSTIRTQSSKQGVVLIIDAADNAQLEADRRHQDSFPKLLLSALSEDPIAGVKLVLTARPHRVAPVVGRSKITSFTLPVFTDAEAQKFVRDRVPGVSDQDLDRALARSGRNARVLAYLVKTWGQNVVSTNSDEPLKADDLIAQLCSDVFTGLDVAGWPAQEVVEFFTALAWLPPPIPLPELAAAMGWNASQLASAASDLAPMLETIPQGVIFRDEPTETYISEHYGDDPQAQKAIANRLAKAQRSSEYAAEVLPNLLVGIGDSAGAFSLADSTDFPASIQSEYSRRRLTMARLKAAFSLGLLQGDKDTIVKLLTRLSQVAAANARGDDFIRRAPGLAVKLGDREVPRRLFNDRSGWRGARHARLTIAHTFGGEFEEASFHGERTVGWVNWYSRRGFQPGPQFAQNVPRAFDFAALILLAMAKGNFALIEHNLALWSVSFGLEVLGEARILAMQYDKINGTKTFDAFETFVASPKCKSATAKLEALSRVSFLCHDRAKKLAADLAIPIEAEDRTVSFERPRPSATSSITASAFNVLLYGSRASAQKLLKQAPKLRPSARDYGEHYGLANISGPMFNACLRAWVEGRAVRYADLLPAEIKIGKTARAINDEKDLRGFIAEIKERSKEKPLTHYKRRPGRPKKVLRARYSDREQREIVKGISLILELIAPLQSDVLAGAKGCTPANLASFLKVWATKLRPLGPRVLEEPEEFLSRTVGLHIANIMLRHAAKVPSGTANSLVDLLTANRFSVSEKIGVLDEIIERGTLSDVAGDLAARITQGIKADDRIDGRGSSYGDLAASLVLLSVDEARSYYRGGLAELDQMGADDYNLLYAMLRFAAIQRGGFIEAPLAHRMMNLAQTVFADEPHKFGWTLFGEVVGHSIGLQAVNKIVRWDEQDVAEYSLGLPQAACALAASGALDPRRAALLLLICEDHNWWDWKIGDGLTTLLERSNTKDRRSIFSLMFDQLKLEHPTGYGSSRWESLLELRKKFEDLISPEELAEIEALRERAQLEVDQFNNKNNHRDDLPRFPARETEETDVEGTLADIIKNLDPASPDDLEAGLKRIGPLPGIGPLQFMERVRSVCPYDKRLAHMRALCEIASFDIQDSFWRLSEAMKDWQATTQSLPDNAKGIIAHLLEFKVTDLFDSDLAGTLDREIYRLSEFCGDRGYVVDAILRTVARAQSELTGEEWLSLASACVPEASPAASRQALESMLANPAARLADEIGEGAFNQSFVPKASEPAFMADLFWHLLGHTDAYIRWSVARAITAMSRLGLTDDLAELVSRFDDQTVEGLATKDHMLAFQNSQQWFLMGLARASLRDGEALEPLRGSIFALAARTDIHIINRKQISRVLSNLPGGASDKMATSLAAELAQPPKGFVVTDKYAKHSEPLLNFRFDYDFDRGELENLARLFRIGKGEVKDAVAAKILARWPGHEDLDFAGRGRYHADRNDRYESYRDHIQRHALLGAATELLQTHPVARSSYDSDDFTPYDDWVARYDLTPKDGSFLADHKDKPPRNASVYLQGRSKGSQPTLKSQDELLGAVGLTTSGESELPLFADWTSPDHVHVRIDAGLGKRRGIIGVCSDFAKRPDHELWIPHFAQDGMVDDHLEETVFDPLIWDPEFYHAGVDQTDEFATEDVMTRTRLGQPLTEALDLNSVDEGKRWVQGKGEGAPALRSQVWGQFQPDEDDSRNRYRNKGGVLWADRKWLVTAADALGQSVVQTVHFSRYKTSRYENDVKSVRAVYLVLHNPDGSLRIWEAKKAAKTDY